MTLRALVTRPEEDAAPLAAALAERGIEVTVEPLLAIRPIADAPIDLAGVQALLFTSANGARCFAALAAERGIAGWRELPVFTVGDASAAAARAAGFGRVESAGGDVTALAKLVVDRLDRKGGALFHAAGSAVAGDLAGQLTDAGFILRREVLYEAKPAEQLSPATVTALANGVFDLVLFFSPRTAATFATLTRSAGDGVVRGCTKASALCLSPAVAAAAQELPWREVHAAARPELPALLDLIDRELASRARDAQAGDTQSIGGKASPTSIPPTAGARRSRLGAIIAVAAAVALIVAGGVELLRPLWSPGADVAAPAIDPALTQRLDDLERRLHTVEASLDAARNDLAGMRDGRTADGERIAALESAARDAQSAPAQIVAGVTERLDKLESGLAALRAAGQQSSATTPSDDVAALAGKIAALEAQFAALPTSPQSTSAPVDSAEMGRLSGENAQLRSDLDALTARLDALDQAMAAQGEDAGGVAFVLAVGNLGSALATSRPFAAELSAVTELAAAESTLSKQATELTAPLAPRAARGVPTLVDLRAGFSVAARAIVDAAKQPESAAAEPSEPRPWYVRDLDWLSAAGDFVTSQVSVRPVGDVVGDDAGARVARAEVRLAEGALAAAVAELEGLSGAPATAAAGWLDDARARLAADQAVAALQAAAVTRLGVARPSATDAGG
jgi:uroporphyrinogen-III synthase